MGSRKFINILLEIIAMKTLSLDDNVREKKAPNEIKSIDGIAVTQWNIHITLILFISELF